MEECRYRAYEVLKSKSSNKTKASGLGSQYICVCVFPGCLVAVSLQTAVSRSPLSLLAIKI